MGRRGVTSSKGTGRGSKGEKTFDVEAVAPIVLFPVTEEDNPDDKGGSEVLFLWNPHDIVFVNKVMWNTLKDNYNSWDPISFDYVVLLLVMECK